jgi:hypothetical protein
MNRMTIAALAVAAAPFFFIPAPSFAQGGGAGGGGTGGAGSGTTGATQGKSGGGGVGGAATTPNQDSTTPNVSNGSVNSAVDSNHPSRSLPTTEAGGGPERTTALNGRVFRGVFKLEGGGTTTGVATMSPGQAMGTTVVTLRLKGATPGTFNWHVHVGRCGDHGTALLGDKSAYPPVRVSSSGTGTARVTLPVEPPSGGNYYVALHPQNGGEDQVVACANLLESGV